LGVKGFTNCALAYSGVMVKDGNVIKGGMGKDAGHKVEQEKN
jgi:hypothetical protein